MERTIRLNHGVWHYDTEQVLGKAGATGEVYVGWSEDRSREVAVKKVSSLPQLSTRREQQIAARFVGKPFKHVVPILDLGQDAESDGYFLVMARADYSLKHWLERTKNYNAIQEAAAVIFDVATGLSELPGLVHRDLKPGNVLKEGGVWKVADFGIAKLTDEEPSDQTLGDHFTAPYASPEQWSHETTTQSTDIYSLGCIAFEIVNGQPPYVGSKDELRAGHRSAPVPPLRSGDSRLDRLVGTMLRKPPTTRPSLGRVIQAALEIIENPRHRATDIEFPELKQVSERLAAREQKQLDAAQATARLREERNKLIAAAVDLLQREIWNPLSEALLATAPNANNMRSEIILGQGSLWVENQVRPTPRVTAVGGWDDVAVISKISVMQAQPDYAREATILYGKPRGEQGYRWYEVSFYGNAAPDRQPASLFGHFVSVGGLQDWIPSDIQEAHPPRPIDDEHRDAFLKRWVRLFALAAAGQLRPPERYPLGDDE
ncbi:MAG: hypothetical protein C0501_27820 [Isosphaera sp.]|nr:hypothetical protein [Isosphaera sp.]